MLGLLVGGANPAPGYTYVAPYVPCADEMWAYLMPLQRSLSPAEGASVPVGTPITFSGNVSRVPVTFSVASSSALLASPDIDSGLGSLQAGSTESIAFTSTKASATPGTIYWDASFSTAGFKECKGETPQIETTQPRTLEVLAPSPPSAPSPVNTEPVVQAPPQVSVSPLSSFRLSRPTVLYRVRCTARCSGTTSYEVLVARHRKKAVRVATLGLDSDAVSITSEGGGEQQISRDYAGRSLRMLEGLIHAGDTVELRIIVSVTGVSGSPVQAMRTAWLHT